MLALTHARTHAPTPVPRNATYTSSPTPLCALVDQMTLDKLRGLEDDGPSSGGGARARKRDQASSPPPAAKNPFRHKFFKTRDRAKKRARDERDAMYYGEDG